MRILVHRLAIGLQQTLVLLQYLTMVNEVISVVLERMCLVLKCLLGSVDSAMSILLSYFQTSLQVIHIVLFSHEDQVDQEWKTPK